MSGEMLQWGHGDEAVEEGLWSVFVAWLGPLQWGHGDEAVEESWKTQKSKNARGASMGPRR